MNNIETMKMALEALEYLDVTAENYVDDRIPYAAITSLRQAIEQAQQAEPVACGYDETTGNCTNNPCCYTSTPPRQPLTDEEIEDLYFDKFSMGELKAFARAIEAAHGIKENT